MRIFKVYKQFYNQQFSAITLFVTTFILMTTLLLNPSPLGRLAQAVLFGLLCLVCGKKVNFLLTFTTFVTILAFNLLLPYGRILFEFSFFKLTEGSFFKGIERASTFTALILLSRLGLREDLKIPTLLGNLLAESLRLFSLMLSYKNSFKGKNWIESLDNLLFSLEKTEEPPSLLQPQYATKTSLKGWVVVVLVVALNGFLTLFH